MDKALVVRDAHRKPPTQLLEKLTATFDPHCYPFPVKFVIVLPEPEAWLLADHGALSAVSVERGTRTIFPPVSRSPEMLGDPKRELQIALGKARVSYTPLVAQRLAELANFGLVERWCPSFIQFRTAVRDC